MRHRSTPHNAGSRALAFLGSRIEASGIEYGQARAHPIYMSIDDSPSPTGPSSNASRSLTGTGSTPTPQCPSTPCSPPGVQATALACQAAGGNGTDHTGDVAGVNNDASVHLHRESENPNPAMKTVASRLSRGVYKRSQRPSEPSITDSRGRVVRSVGMTQTFLSAAQVDELVVLYREGLSRAELGRRFGIHSRTVRAHLVRRSVATQRSAGRAGPPPPGRLNPRR